MANWTFTPTLTDEDMQELYEQEQAGEAIVLMNRRDQATYERWRSRQAENEPGRGAILPWKWEEGEQDQVAINPMTGEPNPVQAQGKKTAAAPGWLLSIERALKLPGQVAQGYQPTERDVAEFGLDLGLLSAAAPVPEGSLRIFGGTAATGVDDAKLGRAIVMKEEEGADTQRIWEETGWEEIDGKWRFEIPTEDLEVDIPVIEQSIRELGDYMMQNVTDEEFEEMAATDSLPRAFARLEDVFKLPQLFQEYPALKESQLYIDPNMETGGAEFDGGQIFIGAKDGIPEGEELKDLLVHEVQHGVQTIEGFQAGGNARFIQENDPEIRDALAELDQKHDNLQITPEEYKEKRQELLTEAFRRYQAIPGEREARGASLRRTMSAEERARTPISATIGETRGAPDEADYDYAALTAQAMSEARGSQSARGGDPNTDNPGVNPLFKRRPLRLGEDDNPTFNQIDLSDFYNPVLNTVEKMDFGKRGLKGQDIAKRVEKTPKIRQSLLRSMSGGRPLFDPEKRYTKQEALDILRDNTPMVTYTVNDTTGKRGNPTYGGFQRLSSEFGREENYGELTVNVEFPKGSVVPKEQQHYYENTLAHARFSVRQDDSGDKFIMVEEIQSDLLQKGYETPTKGNSIDNLVHRDFGEGYENYMRFRYGDEFFDNREKIGNKLKDYLREIQNKPSRAERKETSEKYYNLFKEEPWFSQFDIGDGIASKEMTLGVIGNKIFDNFSDLKSNIVTGRDLSEGSTRLPPIDSITEAVRTTTHALLDHAYKTGVKEVVLPTVDDILSARPGHEEYYNAFKQTYDKAVNKVVKELEREKGVNVDVDQRGVIGSKKPEVDYEELVDLNFRNVESFTPNGKITQGDFGTFGRLNGFKTGTELNLTEEGERLLLDTNIDILDDLTLMNPEEREDYISQIDTTFDVFSYDLGNPRDLRTLVDTYSPSEYLSNLKNGFIKLRNSGGLKLEGSYGRKFLNRVLPDVKEVEELWDLVKKQLAKKDQVERPRTSIIIEDVPEDSQIRLGKTGGVPEAPEEEEEEPKRRGLMQRNE